MFARHCVNLLRGYSGGKRFVGLGSVVQSATVTRLGFDQNLMLQQSKPWTLVKPNLSISLDSYETTWKGGWILFHGPTACIDTGWLYWCSIVNWNSFTVDEHPERCQVESHLSSARIERFQKDANALNLVIKPELWDLDADENLEMQLVSSPNV